VLSAVTQAQSRSNPQASHPGGVRQQGDAGPHHSATDRGMASSPTTLCHVSRSVNVSTSFVRSDLFVRYNFYCVPLNLLNESDRLLLQFGKGTL
jgi:hypothetical protein